MIPVAPTIIKKLGNYELNVRDDGYIFATGLCKAGGKFFADYSKTNHAKEFLECLSSTMQVQASVLVQSVKGGKNQGTWIHPKVAIHLAQWISADFAVQVANIIYKYATNDLTLVQDIVEKVNKDTNTVNNLVIASNPTDLKTVAMLNTYQPDTPEAQAFFDKLQKLVKSLEEEVKAKNEEIKIKDDKIDILTAEIRKQSEQIKELMGYTKEVKVELKVQSEVAKVQSKQIVELNDHVGELLNQVDEKMEVITTLQDEIGIANENIEKVKTHLGIAVEDRVLTDNLAPGDLERVVIYDVCQNGLYYYVRCQTRCIKARFTSLKRTYPNIKQLYEVNYHPNSVSFWKSIMNQYKTKILKQSGNLFKLTITTEELIKVIEGESVRRKTI